MPHDKCCRQRLWQFTHKSAPHSVCFCGPRACRVINFNSSDCGNLHIRSRRNQCFWRAQASCRCISRGLRFSTPHNRGGVIPNTFHRRRQIILPWRATFATGQLRCFFQRCAKRSWRAAVVWGCRRAEVYDCISTMYDPLREYVCCTPRKIYPAEVWVCRDVNLSQPASEVPALGSASCPRR